uniref:PDZ domain-containing protein n=1 Tax=Zooxanthella nutricula TaxID=1333877 RepID=A0A7S2IU09_9DINO
MGNSMGMDAMDTLACARSPCNRNGPNSPTFASLPQSPSSPMPSDTGGSGVAAPGTSPPPLPTKPTKNRTTFEVWLYQTTEEGQDNTLGIKASADRDAGCLVVDEVRTPSLVSAWNADKAEESLKVRGGDKIVQINDAQSHEEMLQEMQKPGDRRFIRLVIQPAEQGAEHVAGRCHFGTLVCGTNAEEPTTTDGGVNCARCSCR